MQACEVAGLIKNGQGGLNWASLPFVAVWLNVKDIDMLCHRLKVLALHRAPQDGDDAPPPQE